MRYQPQVQNRTQHTIGRLGEDGEHERWRDSTGGGPIFPARLSDRIVLEWPGLYHDVERMCLVLGAKVVRSEGTRTALQVLRHEFLEVPAVQRSKPMRGVHTAAEAGRTSASSFLPSYTETNVLASLAAA